MPAEADEFQAGQPGPCSRQPAAAGLGELINRRPPVSRACRRKNVPVSVLRPYIDWTPFFLSWSWRAKSAHSRREEVGEKAKLFADANAMLDKLEQDESVRCAGIS
ncbi:vitamin B12 dependent-methionine synthase activation domain-containing protein [Escherichia coli]